MESIRIATLNLWNLKHWDERFPAIVEEINLHSPDVIFLQEAQVGESIDQVRQLAETCSYKFFEHTPFTTKNGFSHGLGILSRFPFSSTKHNHEYVRTEQRGFIEITISTPQHKLSAVTVHFDNTNEGSLIHLGETLAYLGNRLENTIIAGDFNCFDAAAVTSATQATHVNSYDITPYVSYPDEGTLDYILIPRSMHTKALMCIERHLSDHRMLIADIEIT